MLDEIAAYLLFGGIISGFLLVVAVLPGIALMVLFVGRHRAAELGRQVVLLCTIVFLFGAPANALFVHVMHGRYYIPGDTIVDWLPWFPSGDWSVDPGAFGGRYLNGASARTVGLAWGALAVPVWTASVGAFTAIRKRQYLQRWIHAGGRRTRR